MSVRIAFKHRQLQRQIRRASRACRNMRPAYQKIGQLMMESVRETFRAGGRPRRWPRNKPRRNELSRRPLEETGKLRSSISYLASRGDMTIGSDLIYAAVHQYGARPFLVIQTEDEERMVDVIEEHILGDL